MAIGKIGHVSEGGFGGLGQQLASGSGFAYNVPKFSAGMNAPSGMTEDALQRYYTPEQMGQMNFEGANAGQFGTDAPTSMFGGAGGTDWMGGLGAISSGIGAASNLMNSINAGKQLKLANEKFGAEKAIANANYINSARLSNADDKRKTGVGLALGGNAITDAQRASTMAGLEARKLSENAIV